MRTALAAGLAALLLTVPASAPAAGTAGAFDLQLAPNTPATGTGLAIKVDGSKLPQPLIPSQASMPNDLRVEAPVGLAIDPEAVAGRCTSSRSCPADSQIGTGTAAFTGYYYGMSAEFSATMDLYLAAPTHAGDLADVIVDAFVNTTRVTLTGRLVPGADGKGPTLLCDMSEIRAKIPSGASGRLNSLTFDLRAQRTVKVTTTKTKTVTVKKRVRGKNGRVRVVKVRKRKRVKITRDVVHQLLTTPPTCSTSWAATAEIGFADGAKASSAVAIPCAA